jgi:hypothetical protein
MRLGLIIRGSSWRRTNARGVDCREGTHLKSGLIVRGSLWRRTDARGVDCREGTHLKSMRIMIFLPSAEWIIPESFACDRPVEVVSHM